jgi:hypothetical protein
MIEDLIEQALDRREGGRGRGDSEDFGEDEFAEDEEEPSEFPGGDEDDDRLDMPSSRHPAGSGYPANANKEFRRYSRAVASGDVYGTDIWRFSMGQKIKGDPIDKGRRAVSRFSRAWR